MSHRISTSVAKAKPSTLSGDIDSAEWVAKGLKILLAFACAEHVAQHPRWAAEKRAVSGSLKRPTIAAPKSDCTCCSQRNPDNVMRKVECAKLVINIAVGESGDRLTKAVRVLQQLSDQTPVENYGAKISTDASNHLTSTHLAKYLCGASLKLSTVNNICKQGTV